jgi:hypothetical protein
MSKIHWRWKFKTFIYDEKACEDFQVNYKKEEKRKNQVSYYRFGD